jgi:hypothetical protein
MLFSKSVDSLEESDLQELVETQVREGKELDYKEQLSVEQPSEKKEFLNDVSSFANASGGYLIYGVKESGEDAGLPVDLPGLQLDNPGKFGTTLENIIQTGLDPRLPASGVHVQVVSLPSKQRWAIVIHIQKSWISPHMVKVSGRFFSRKSSGKYDLDVSELRTAFELLGRTADRIRSFRADRLSKIVAGEIPLLLGEYVPKLVLHIVPFQAFDPAVQVDIVPLLSQRELIEPLMLPESSQHGADVRYNFDGLLSWYSQPRTYVQFFRNGSVEGVDTSILSVSGEARVFSGPTYERRIRQAVSRYAAAQKQLGVEPPLFVMVSLLGVKGYRLQFQHAGYPWDDYKIDRSDLIISETVIESFDFDMTQVTSPIFDTIANAAAWKHSMVSYDEYGQSSFRSE